MSLPLHLYKTTRFFVLCTNGLSDCCCCTSRSGGKSTRDLTTSCALPVMNLGDLLLHQRRKIADKVRDQLWRYLEQYGFVILVYSKDSKPAQVVDEMRCSLYRDFFPSFLQEGKVCRNAASLQTGDVYLSERGVPMWRLGYELCDDIRETFRIHAACPDSQPWPEGNTTTPTPRQAWLRGLAFCRHICDQALHLTLNYTPSCRPGSGLLSWNTIPSNYCTYDDSSQHRPGDYSVLYAMHYFNDDLSRQARQSGETTGVTDVTINVKQHVDPSLFVLEPFLAEREGLQVWSNGEWITCDGPSSPIRSSLKDGQDAMVLFVGKAFSANCGKESFSVEPTLHRVVAPPSLGSRRTMIYEQKYEEYFPAPALD